MSEYFRRGSLKCTDEGTLQDDDLNKTQLFSLISVVAEKQHSAALLATKTICMQAEEVFDFSWLYADDNDDSFPIVHIGPDMLFLNAVTLASALCSTLRLLAKDKIVVVYDMTDVRVTEIVFNMRERREYFDCPSVCEFVSIGGACKNETYVGLNNTCLNREQCVMVLLVEPLKTFACLENKERGTTWFVQELIESGVRYFYVGLPSTTIFADYYTRRFTESRAAANLDGALIVVPEVRRSAGFVDFVSNLTLREALESNMCWFAQYLASENNCDFETCNCNSEPSWGRCKNETTLSTDKLSELALDMSLYDVEYFRAFAHVLRDGYRKFCAANTDVRSCDEFLKAHFYVQEGFGELARLWRTVSPVRNDTTQGIDWHTRYTLLQSTVTMNDSTGAQISYEAVGHCEVTQKQRIDTESQLSTTSVDCDCTLDMTLFKPVVFPPAENVDETWRRRTGKEVPLEGSCNTRAVLVDLWYPGAVAFDIALAAGAAGFLISAIFTPVVLKRHWETPFVSFAFGRNSTSLLLLLTPLFFVLSLLVGISALSFAACLLFEFLFTSAVTMGLSTLLAKLMVDNRVRLSRQQRQGTGRSDDAETASGRGKLPDLTQQYRKQLQVVGIVYSLYVAVFASSSGASAFDDDFVTYGNASSSAYYAAACTFVLRPRHLINLVPGAGTAIAIFVVGYRSRNTQFVIVSQEIIRFCTAAALVLVVSSVLLALQYVPASSNVQISVGLASTNCLLFGTVFAVLVEWPVMFSVVAQREKNTESFLCRKKRLRHQRVGGEIIMLHTVDSFQKNVR